MAKMSADKGTGRLRILMIDRILIWHLVLSFMRMVFATSPKRFFYEVSYKNPSPACPL